MYSPFYASLRAALLACLLSLTTVIILRLWVHRTSNSVTFLGEDFLRWTPIDLPYVTTVIEDSLRFKAESLEFTTDAWISNIPRGMGYVRLGPEYRVFTTATYHEQHCYLMFHQWIGKRAVPGHHIQHCLNYVRQNILCTADATLEPLDDSYEYTDEELSYSANGYTRVCKDWRVLYDYNTKNYEAWLYYRQGILQSHKNDNSTLPV